MVPLSVPFRREKGSETKGADLVPGSRQRMGCFGFLELRAIAGVVIHAHGLAGHFREGRPCHTRSK